MNDADTIARLEQYTRISDLAAEHAALDYVAMRDRITSLEDDCTTYRMLAAAGLESIVQLTKRNKQLARRVDEQATQIHALLTAPCLACRRAGRAERAA